MEVRFLPPEPRACHPGAVSLRVSAWPVAALCTAMVAQASPARASTSVAVQLRTAQHRLDRVTESIRTGTAVWLALVSGVRARQGVIKHGGADARRARRELAAVLPAWLAVKASLHRRYREVKEVFRETDALTKRLLGPPARAGSRIGRWWHAWPLRLRNGPVIRVCPVQGPLSLTDSFGAPRPGGRIHEGNDLFAATGTPVVAVADGIVVREPNTLGGRAVVLRTGAGYFYYAHLSSYGASGPVAAGDLIGSTGTSGDAKGLIPQVHFEYHPGGGPAVDPFPFLQPVC